MRDIKNEYPEIEPAMIAAEPRDATSVEDVREAYFWVGNRLEDKDVAQSDAPSNAAWGLYKWAVESTATKAKFWEKYNTMLPTKTEVEQEVQVSTDSEVDRELISKTIKLSEKARNIT